MPKSCRCVTCTAGGKHPCCAHERGQRVRIIEEVPGLKFKVGEEYYVFTGPTYGLVTPGTLPLSKHGSAMYPFVTFPTANLEVVS